MTWKDANDKMLQLLGDDYVPLVCYHLNKEEDIKLSDSVPGTCRFCGRSKPEVTFKKVAHAIPHFIGNRTLKSTYECDDCNGLFSSMESNFSNFMSFYHTFAQVNKGGGAKVPKYRANSSEKSFIEVKENGFNINCFEGEGLVPVIDEDNKTLTLKTNRSYVPVNVYKIFIKMALSIIPEEELKDLSVTKKWLHGDIAIDAQGLMLVERRYMRFFNPFVFDSCMIFKRKDSCTKAVPSYIFGLAYYNFFFQTYIPFCDTDKQFRGAQLTMPYIPTPLDAEGIRPETKTYNLSSSEKVSKEEVSITLKAEQLEGVDLSDA